MASLRHLCPVAVVTDALGPVPPVAAEPLVRTAAAAPDFSGLGNGQPVLTSGLGELGVRDPSTLRSPGGDRFSLPATALKSDGGRGWDAAQRTGSRSAAGGRRSVDDTAARTTASPTPPLRAPPAPSRTGV